WLDPVRPSVVVGVLLTGCVSLTPQQQATVDQLQLVADRTTEDYRLPRLRLSVPPPSNLNTGAVYRQGNVLVNVRMLDAGLSPSLKVLIAHELGHYVLGHEPASFVSSTPA